MGDGYRKVLVMGLGYRTGLATADFLCSRGKDVTVSDIKTETELKDVIMKLDPSVRVIAGHQEPSILDAGYDMIVLSPGVPAAIPLVQEAYRRNIPVISEIELAYRNMKGRFIGITGTDGKSTTTSLTGHILRELGFDTFVGGNIGIPLISFAGRTADNSVTVIELSSFQLETIDTFKPDVSAILNVTSDHLDRYGSMDEYFTAKKRIFMRQDNSDFFIYNRDSRILENSRMYYPSNTLTFSIYDEGADSFCRDGIIYTAFEGSNIPVVKTSKLRILGIHNIQNVMAAVLMVLSLYRKLGLTPDFPGIAAACGSFQGLEHRMEYTGEFMGRTFINDSKATTIGAVEMAVKSIKDRGVVIIGGRTKGDDYSKLREVIGHKARCIVLIGESSDIFSGIFRDFNTVKASSMEDAVAKAMKNSEEGDIILLSPACASFDMFSSYEERGRVFKECFKKLSEGGIAWI